MNLQGRNLSLDMQGAEVGVLHAELSQLRYHIAEDETAEQRFGEGTREAVRAFQRTYGLEITGVVDERTVKLMNAVIEALQPQPDRFIVRGQVRLQDGSPLSSAIVLVFDKDIPSTEPQRKAITDEGGRYEITYTVDHDRRADKSVANLVVRVFDLEGIPLDESDIAFDTPGETTVDLVVISHRVRPPSEYQQLLAEITPLIENMPVAELTDEDVTSLVEKVGVDKQHLEFLVQSAKLSKETDL